MGLDMELDSEKSCNSDLSPNTVLPCRHFPDAEKRRTNSKHKRKDDLLTAKEGFTEISFRRYRSASCKTPSRPVGLEDNIELKRGSVYQSSREVRKMKKMGSDEGRRKIEISRESDTSFSFSIVDSLYSPDEENTRKKSPPLSVNSNLNPTSIRRSCAVPCSLGSYIEIFPDLDKREKQSAGTVRSDSIENPTFRCEQVVSPANGANELLEKDATLTFYKSLSAKVEMPHSPSPSESVCSSRASTKSRFSPIRKIFDPFMKSKSLRNPFSYVAEPGDVKTTGMTNIRKNQISRKPLLHDLSNTAVQSDVCTPIMKKDHNQSALASSPVHLHACLKLENKQGVPCFEFSLDCPEEVLFAKTWKANDAFNWVYTFHSVGRRKKSNARGWGMTDGNKEPPVMGQMQVSCYLCSELRQGGVFGNSMATEFVLYDIAHARQSVSSQDLPDIVKPPSELDSGSEPLKLKHRMKLALDSDNFDPSNPYPFPSAVLHSALEIAAIVIQLPFSKKESLKYKGGDKSSDQTHTNLINQSMFEQRRKGTSDRESREKVKIAIPTGNHSLPIDESQGPSSLLDRWRLGGSCDCGGWDMGCPLTVFNTSGITCAEDEPLVDDWRPLEIFLQGTKQKIPALTLRVVEQGKYAVDFHAQLSTLQAFSICVAVLHGTEASSASKEEKSKKLPHCSSLKVLIEEEVQFLLEAVTEEEKKKKEVSKKIEDIQQSYVLNPPISPIARV